MRRWVRMSAVHPVVVGLLTWTAAQPVLGLTWAHALRQRRTTGGN